MKYQKRPVIVEAMMWAGDYGNLLDWMAKNNITGIKRGGNQTLLIPTLEGEMTARLGDWIIQGIQGEVYPCKPDIFQGTYVVIKEAL